MIAAAGSIVGLHTRDSAVWLEPGDRLSVHEDGTLEIAW